MNMAGTLTVIDLCGSESAQVVAAHAATWLRRLAPDFRLQTRPESSSEEICGYIVLLPAEKGRAQSAWHRFQRDAANCTPTLPLRIGEEAAQSGVVLKETGALPELHISPSEARIEHGGRLLLESETAGLLSRRLSDLLAISRRFSTVRSDGTDCGRRPAAILNH